MKITDHLVNMRAAIAYALIRSGEAIALNGNRYRLSSRLDTALEMRRHQISRDLTEVLDNTVRYGNFLGMKFASESIWGALDRANMLLGLYEREVSDLLLGLSKLEDNRFLVDCGAADGYFAIGTLVSKEFDFVWAFEQSEKQRGNLLINAEANNVKDSIEIFGSAEHNFLDHLEKDRRFVFESTTFLFDIEGAEYLLLSQSNLSRLKNSVLVVELHDFNSDQKSDRALLIERAMETHHGYLISTGSRDLSGIHEIAHLNDSNRWLICSEGRPRVMDWLVLFPLAMENRLIKLGIAHREI